ncbi:helix-turn-helix transcriptional regulator [Halopseudomonas sp. SMJS2]|uniref:helix-turn-helix transcriptional regulator n=1 Tax=Halopseudomonas sp. SMJS2 TaxID=3041098 RepID=UPI002453534D|nr:helix-turn-helix transcriptional regulator [Halopseudomonas sp. SMJS2]WGK60885.1 helix-turn-helix transcriptional regulator [Halopseudomonas sp. SMJS2]
MNADRRRLDMETSSFDLLLGELYDAAMDDHSWSRYLTRLQKLFQANYVTLILRIPQDSDRGLMLIIGDIEGQGTISYTTYPGSETPFVNCPVNQVFTITDLMSLDSWRESDYYRRHCTQQNVFYVMGVDIAPPSGGIFRFRVTRPETDKDFSATDRALCDALIPHMSRALHIHSLLGHKHSLSALYAQAMGRLSIATLILDSNGHLLETNQVAREMLAAGDGLKIVGGRLEASYPGDNKRLYKSIRAAAASSTGGRVALAEALSIARPSGQVSLGIVVEPVPQQNWDEGESQPAVVIYCRDAVGQSLLSTSVTRQVFGFTPSESALAMELANGLSLEEAAGSLGIRRNTARAHLRAIFSKTGVRRQTELVRLILNSVVTLGQS